MNRTAIRCRCGQRIGEREVMHTGYYPRMFGPSLVAVRYRCPRCKKVDEQYVRQEEWDSGILRDDAIEASDNEMHDFIKMGPIEMDELVEFHKQLEKLDDLNEINNEFSEWVPTDDEE